MAEESHSHTWVIGHYYEMVQRDFLHPQNMVRSRFRGWKCMRCGLTDKSQKKPHPEYSVRINPSTGEIERITCDTIWEEKIVAEIHQD